MTNIYIYMTKSYVKYQQVEFTLKHHLKKITHHDQIGFIPEICKYSLILRNIIYIYYKED